MFKSETKIISIFTFGLLGFTLFSGFLLASSSLFAEVVDVISINVPVSCSLLSTSSNYYSETISNGIYYQPIGETLLKASCNDDSGFAIYASGYTGDEMGTEDSNKLIGTNSLSNIVTGTASSGPVSNWAMKLTATAGPYTAIVAGSSADTEKETGDPDYSTYSEVPNYYKRVAYRNSSTDTGGTAVGSTLTASYAVYISPNQYAGSYAGQVIYTLLHPSTRLEHPVQKQLTVTYDAHGGYYGDPAVTTNTVSYEAVCDSEVKEFEVVHTSNVDDAGNKLSPFNTEQPFESYEVYIPNASKLKVVINYDLLFNENNPLIEEYGYSYYQLGEIFVRGNEDYKLYGSGNQTIIIEGNSVEIGLWIENGVTINSSHDYGFFAQVYPLDENDEEYSFTKYSSCTWRNTNGSYMLPNYPPNAVIFGGWSLNNEGDLNIDESGVIDYLLRYSQSTNVTVYAEWAS